MPQMFPLMWTILFFSTAALLISMMSLMFFKTKPSLSNSESKKEKSKNAIWKW